MVLGGFVVGDRMDALNLIADIVQRVLEPLAPDTPLQSIPGWDSLKLVQLVLRLETQLNRELTEDEIEGLLAIGDVDRLLNTK